jgi:DNA-binding transcriptional ArsR family regulator
MSPKLRAALMETFADPLRIHVYIAVYERPGATVAHVAARIEEPERRVRHEIDRLIDAGLVIVDAESLEREARERHHRAVAAPTLDEQRDEPWTDVDRRAMSLSIMKFIAADIGRAIRNRTLGTRPGHAEVRVPGEVDQRGWEDLTATMVATMQRAEETMIGSAARLEAAGESGAEVIAAPLLFQVPAWGPSADGGEGSRRSPWAPSASEPYLTFDARPGSRRLSPDLRDALFESLGDQLRARVLIAVAEKPGATIGQIATRIGESPRRVRHQIDRLVELGLIVIDAETLRRNARERHYRAIALPRIVQEVGSGWADEHWRRIAFSIVRTIMADLDGAFRGETLGARSGYAVVRIPGEVDERGWDELAATMVRTTEEIEATMVRSAVRLEDAGRSGIEVISALLLFEAMPWGQDEADRRGPRPTHWTAVKQATNR